MVGQSIAHYAIREKLGQGGMGEVYLAEDLKLGRQVAIKVLPPELERDPLASRRFLREARSSAALDHPFIAQIHEIGEWEGRTFIVMEYLRGKTLKERLGEGPIPADEVLRIGAEIAEALQTAHDAGIIHRDLKPSNIMLTESGHAKVMDFGLAKVVTMERLQDEDEPLTGLTGVGIRLGTVPYMSPEQLKGAELDARSDLFSLGILVFEMLTGRHPFRRTEVVETASAILKDPPPPLGAFVGQSSELLDHIITKMLAKRLEERYQLAREIRTDLLDALSRLERGSALRQEGGWDWKSLSLLLVLAALAGVMGWWLGQSENTVPLERGIRLELGLPPESRLAHYYRPGIALSPDARVLAVTAGTFSNPYIFPDQVRIYVRYMDQWNYQPVAGTENGIQPVFSPDGQFLAFTQYDPDLNRWYLKKVRLSGGEPITLCQCEARWGVTWPADDEIIFGSGSGGLFVIPASGGEPVPLTEPEPDSGSRGHRLPHSITGEDVVFYTVPRQPDALAGDATVWVLSRRSGESKPLVEGWDGRYVRSGHLLYGVDGVLKAVPFDLERLEVTGPEVTFLEGVTQSLYTVNPTLRTGALQLAASESGLLAYATGSVFPEVRGPVTWVDRTGQEEPLALAERNYFSVRLSPEESEALLTVIYPPQDVWLYDLVRRGLKRQTFEGSNVFAIWGPGDGHFTFSSNLDGERRVFSKPIDSGMSGAKALPRPDQGYLRPSSWSPDGRTLAAVGLSPVTGFDILLMSSEGELRPYLNSPFSEQYPEFSPDGKWMAYSTNESGRQEVYIRAFPDGVRSVQVSTDGGVEPAWSRDGKEIVFRWRQTFYSVAVAAGDDQIRVSQPVRLFEGDYGSSIAVRSYDLASDGRFLVSKRPDGEALLRTVDGFFPTRIQVIHHWLTELSERAPAR